MLYLVGTALPCAARAGDGHRTVDDMLNQPLAQWNAAGAAPESVVNIHRPWLGSDYLLSALHYEPNAQQRRVGDGYYEQGLIRDQVLSLTGRRFIGDYSSAGAGKQLTLQGAQVYLSGALNSQESTVTQTSKSTALHAGVVKPSEGMLSRGGIKGADSQTSLAATTLSGGNITISATGQPGKGIDGNPLQSGISLAGVSITTPGQLALDAGKGTLAFNIIETTQSTSKETTQRDLAYQVARGQGSSEGTAQYNALSYGSLAVHANTVTIQTATATTGKGKVDSSVGTAVAIAPVSSAGLAGGKDGAGNTNPAAAAAAQVAGAINGSTNANANLNLLAQRPGMGWVSDVVQQQQAAQQSNPALALHVQNVQLAHDQWDYRRQGLTQEGAAIVTLVVAYFTAGAASGAGSALASGAGMTAATTTVAGTTIIGGGLTLGGTIVAGVVTAGISTLAAQGSVSLINNRGNIGATLNDLGSSSNMRGLVTAMLTGGCAGGYQHQLGQCRRDRGQRHPMEQHQCQQPLHGPAAKKPDPRAQQQCDPHCGGGGQQRRLCAWPANGPAQRLYQHRGGPRGECHRR